MPIESRGQKDPALAARIKAGALPEEDVVDVEYVVGRRQLKVGEETRQPGDPIPEAAQWPRLESWLRSGAIAQRPRQTATELVDIPGDGVRKTGHTVPADGRMHTAVIDTVLGKATAAQSRHDEDEPPRRPVLRPIKGVNA